MANPKHRDSYTELAGRMVDAGRYVSPPTKDWPSDLWVEWNERAAILQHMEMLSVYNAEWMAYYELRNKYDANGV